MAITQTEAIDRLRKRKVAIVRAYKSERGCCRCDEDDWRCLDLHHRDPATKNPRLTRRQGKRGYGLRSLDRLSYEDLKAELAKCDVMCANCHRKEHTVTGRSSGAE